MSITDPKNRPVYEPRQEADYHYLRLFVPGPGGVYQFEDDYRSLDDLLVDYPTAVKVVNRRSSPNKKRHPHVHYRPSGKAAYCRSRLPQESTLRDDQRINAKYQTDVARVTCPVCIKAIREAIAR